MSDNDTNKPPMTVTEAGRLGGQAVKEMYGSGYYARIGSKGGRSLSSSRGPEHFKAIGKKGGLAVHAKHPDLARRAGQAAGAKVKKAMALLKAAEENKP